MTSELLKSPEVEGGIAVQPAFTYFMDINGHIFYSFGRGTHLSPGEVKSTAVYENISDGPRRSFITGRNYKKNIQDGCIPGAENSYAGQYLTTDLNTGEKLLAVSKGNI